MKAWWKNQSRITRYKRPTTEPSSQSQTTINVTMWDKLYWYDMGNLKHSLRQSIRSSLPRVSIK